MPLPGARGIMGLIIFFCITATPLHTAMSFARPADEYSLKRLKRDRAKEAGYDYDALQDAMRRTQQDLERSEAEFLARKNKTQTDRANKIQNIKNTQAKIHQDSVALAKQRDANLERADTAWLLNKYIDLHPDKKAMLENYIPTATIAEMEATQKAKDYQAGWYTNGRVENDAEAWMKEHNMMEGGLGYDVSHAWRFLWSGEEKLEQGRKVATTYTNSAYDGMSVDERAATVRDQSFVRVIGDTLTGGKGNSKSSTLGTTANSGGGLGLGVFGQNGDLNPLNLGWELWETIKKAVARIPIYVDVAVVLGGLAFTYFGLVDGSGSLALPGVLMLGTGGFAIYCWYKYNVSSESTTDAPGTGTRKRDAMGNDQKLIPDSKH